MPVTICAAMRAGSLRAPTAVEVMPRLISMKRQHPRPTSRCVRSPAGLCPTSRSQPIGKTSTRASPTRINVSLQFIAAPVLSARSSTAARTSSTVTPRKHPACPCQQNLAPCGAHGRQARSRSRTVSRSPSGPKPKSRTVEPKMATTGTPSATARCMIPESFVTSARQRSRIALSGRSVARTTPSPSSSDPAGLLESERAHPARFERRGGARRSVSPASASWPATLPARVRRRATSVRLPGTAENAPLRHVSSVDDHPGTQSARIHRRPSRPSRRTAGRSGERGSGRPPAPEYRPPPRKRSAPVRAPAGPQDASRRRDVAFDCRSITRSKLPPRASSPGVQIRATGSPSKTGARPRPSRPPPALPWRPGASRFRSRGRRPRGSGTGRRECAPPYQR